MPTTLGPLNATALLLYVGGNVVAHSTDYTLKVDSAIIDATSRNSAGWANNLQGLRKWSITVAGLVAYDDVTGNMTFMQAVINRTELTVKFTTGVTGDYYQSGLARVSTYSQTAKMESTSTYSVTLEGDGPITIGTN